MSWRKLLVASLASAFAIALFTGCGNAASSSVGTTSTSQLEPPPPAVGPASAHDLSAVRQAAAHTLAQHAVVSIQVLSPPSIPYPPVTARGAFDLSGPSGQEIAHDSVGAQTLVFTPTQVFDRRPPAELAGLPHGRPWIKVDLNEHLITSNFLAGFVQNVEQIDPGFLLAEVAWGARDAAPLGESTVDGTRTAGYLVHVEPAHAAATASGPGARGFVGMAALARQELGRGLAAPVSIRVWVDEAGRVVSLRASTVSSPFTSGGGTILMRLRSFGTRVRFSPPALDHTIDLAALVGADNDHD